MYSKEKAYLFSYASMQKQLSPSSVQKLFQKSVREERDIFQLTTREREDFFSACLGEDSKEYVNLLSFWEELEEFSYFEKAKKELKVAEEKGLQMISYGEESYPNSFYGLKQPPYILFILGRFPEEEEREKSLAIVGTREMSSVGKAFAKDLAKEAKALNYYTISGLARGIDAEVHRNSLERTGAILAHGFDLPIYPKEHHLLAKEIIAEGGFLLSDFPFGLGMRKEFFIRRNRLQAALAKSLCVVETAIKGGSVHTFHFAKSLGKRIYVPDFNQEFIKKYAEKVVTVSSPAEIFLQEQAREEQKRLF